MAEVEIKIGATLRGTLAELGAAWKAAEAGQAVPATETIAFVDWRAFSAVMTPKRYELVRRLRHAPAPGIRALARDLGRDVKRVHEDVVTLTELGLIDRDPKTGTLSTRLDKVTSTIDFAA